MLNKLARKAIINSKIMKVSDVFFNNSSMMLKTDIILGQLEKEIGVWHIQLFVELKYKLWLVSVQFGKFLLMTLVSSALT